MPWRRARAARRLACSASMRPFSLLLAVAAGALIAGCGGNDDSDRPPPQPAPTAQPQDFPKPAAGSNLQDLINRYQRGPNLAPSVSLLNRGADRFGFALFDDARKQLGGAAV